MIAIGFSENTNFVSFAYVNSCCRRPCHVLLIWFSFILFSNRVYLAHLDQLNSWIVEDYGFVVCHYLSCELNISEQCK